MRHESISSSQDCPSDQIMLFELLSGWAAIIIREIDQTRGRVIKFVRMTQTKECVPLLASRRRHE